MADSLPPYTASPAPAASTIPPIPTARPHPTTPRSAAVQVAGALDGTPLCRSPSHSADALDHLHRSADQRRLGRAKVAVPTAAVEVDADSARRFISIMRAIHLPSQFESFLFMFHAPRPSPKADSYRVQRVAQLQHPTRRHILQPCGH
jgi:hypothetical protein